MSNQYIIKRLEGKIRVKGFTIAYVLWMPYNSNSNIINGNENYLDPISISSFVDETILAFHGWLDNANSFEPISPKLINKFISNSDNKILFRVISFDLPGHGKSSHSLVGYYSTIMYITTIIRIINKLKLDSLHFMSHSLSASMLPYILRIIEEKGSNLFHVKSLICFDQFGATTPTVRMERVHPKLLLPTYEEEFQQNIEDELNKQNDQSVGNTKMIPKLYDSIDELVSSRMWVVSSVYPGTQSIDQHSARLILQRNVGKIYVIERDSTKDNKRKKVLKYYLRIDPLLKNGKANSLEYGLPLHVPEMVDQLLNKTTVPMLAIFGEKGWPNLDVIAKMTKNINYLDVKYVKGSHHVHMDDPDVCLKHVIPFIYDAIKKYDIKYNNERSNKEIQMQVDKHFHLHKQMGLKSKL